MAELQLQLRGPARRRPRPRAAPLIVHPFHRAGVAHLFQDGGDAVDAPAVWGPVDARGDLVRGDRPRVRVEPGADDFLGNLVDRPVLLGQEGLWGPSGCRESRWSRGSPGCGGWLRPTAARQGVQSVQRWHSSRTSRLHPASAPLQEPQRWIPKFGQLAKVGSRPRRRSLACHGRDGVILLS